MSINKNKSIRKGYILSKTIFLTIGALLLITQTGCGRVDTYRGMQSNPMHSGGSVPASNSDEDNSNPAPPVEQATSSTDQHNDYGDTYLILQGRSNDLLMDYMEPTNLVAQLTTVTNCIKELYSNNLCCMLSQEGHNSLDQALQALNEVYQELKSSQSDTPPPPPPPPVGLLAPKGYDPKQVQKKQSASPPNNQSTKEDSSNAPYISIDELERVLTKRKQKQQEKGTPEQHKGGSKDRRLSPQNNTTQPSSDQSIGGNNRPKPLLAKKPPLLPKPKGTRAST